MKENFSTSRKHQYIFVIIYHTKYFKTILLVFEGGGIQRQGTVSNGRRHTFAISAEFEQCIAVMIHEVEPEEERRRVHRWVKIDERPVTNSGKHIAVDIFRRLYKTKQFSLHFFKLAVMPIHESMTVFGANNVEQSVGIYEEGVMEKADRLLEMVFGFPATVSVSSAPEKVRIMILTPLV
jgi:hypothetical protein